MKRTVLAILVALISGCATPKPPRTPNSVRSEDDQLKSAAEILSGRSSATADPIPLECPYNSPAVSEERVGFVAAAVQKKVGVPANVAGPYSREHLEWLVANGQQSVPGGTSKRVDYLDIASLDLLIKATTGQAEIWFYIWDPEDSLWTGFVVVDESEILELIATFQT